MIELGGEIINFLLYELIDSLAAGFQGSDLPRLWSFNQTILQSLCGVSKDKKGTAIGLYTVRRWKTRLL
jgi:hypothetical protein